MQETGVSQIFMIDARVCSSKCKSWENSKYSWLMQEFAVFQIFMAKADFEVLQIFTVKARALSISNILGKSKTEKLFLAEAV